MGSSHQVRHVGVTRLARPAPCSLSQAKILEEAENHSETVEVTQEVEERDGITETDMEESAATEPVHGRYGLVALVLLLLIALLYIIHLHTISHAQRNTSK